MLSAQWSPLCPGKDELDIDVCTVVASDCARPSAGTVLTFKLDRRYTSKLYLAVDDFNEVLSIIFFQNDQ